MIEYNKYDSNETIKSHYYILGNENGTSFSEDIYLYLI